MITALTTIFVLVSLGLIVTVPVALATPGEWENSKQTFKQESIPSNGKAITLNFRKRRNGVGWGGARQGRIPAAAYKQPRRNGDPYFVDSGG